MTTTPCTNHTAAQRYAFRLAECRALMATLSAKLDRMEATDNPHWGHVGDVADIANTLENLAVARDA